MSRLLGELTWRHFLAGLVMLGVTGLGLATIRAQGKPADEPASNAPKPQTEERAQAEEPAAPTQPEPEEIIHQLKRDRVQNLPIPPARQGETEPDEADHFFQPVSPNVQLEPLLPEGAYLVDRAGRLVKSGRWWTFVMEERSRVVRSRPIRILPSQLLETMEQASARDTGDVVFVVSGETTEFHGVNYLLLRKVLIQRNLGNVGGAEGT